MIGQPPRYSLDEPCFPFPALAAAAGRSALGGPREVTLACLMAVRLTSALIEPFGITSEAHHERSDRGRQWSATLTIPGEVRATLIRVIELAGRSDGPAAGVALDDLLSVATIHLDDPSRREMKTVAERLRSAPSMEPANAVANN